jgi:hypothetical protein
MLANPTRGGTQAPSTANNAQYGAAGALAANAGVDSTRYVRAVRYSLPAFVTGLSVNATMAYGTVASSTAAAAGNSSGLDITYAAGPLALVFATQKAEATKTVKPAQINLSPSPKKYEQSPDKNVRTLNGH